MAYPKHRKKVPYEKLLLLEDDLSLIDGLSFAFQRAGHELEVARTLQEAENLQQALVRLEDANTQLERDVEKSGFCWPIPESDLPKIWTKSYRDSRGSYSGSGLGLSIVAQVLSMQDLPYGAEDQAGGVRSYFSIPVTE